VSSIDELLPRTRKDIVVNLQNGTVGVIVLLVVIVVVVVVVVVVAVVVDGD